MILEADDVHEANVTHAMHSSGVPATTENPASASRAGARPAFQLEAEH